MTQPGSPDIRRIGHRHGKLLTGSAGPGGGGGIAVDSHPGQAFQWTGLQRYRLPEGVVEAQILGVSSAVGLAPTGASLIVDVHKNGTTIYTTQANRPTIPVTSFDGPETVPNVTQWLATEYLTFDIDQVGSTIAGAHLTIMLRWIVVT